MTVLLLLLLVGTQTISSITVILQHILPLCFVVGGCCSSCVVAIGWCRRLLLLLPDYGSYGDRSCGCIGHALLWCWLLLFDGS